MCGCVCVEGCVSEHVSGCVCFYDCVCVCVIVLRGDYVYMCSRYCFCLCMSKCVSLCFEDCVCMEVCVCGCREFFLCVKGFVC